MPAGDDECVHIYFDNALRFIRRRTDEYDLIIVDSTDPFGLRKVILQKSSMESATMHYMRTESWSISREARFISTMQKRCSAATSGSSVHFQSAECISTHPDLCGRILALWFRKQKISSAG